MSRPNPVRKLCDFRAKMIPASAALAFIVFGLFPLGAYGQERLFETAVEKPATADARAPKSAKRLEARCSDGSVLRVRLLDTHIPLKTDYGTIKIPIADIERIQFKTRLPEALATQVKHAIEQLASDKYEEREAASAELLALQEIAYPALVDAGEDGDREVVRRAQQLLSQIRGAVPEDLLEVQEFDVIHTANSQIAGIIDLESLRIETLPFGEQKLKLVMLRRLQGNSEEVQVDAMPDPGNLSNYQQSVGKTLHFRVTAGSRNGYVWGSDAYTLDSTLSMAAVHAGVLKQGETKVVAVTIQGPLNSFQGSFRNGIRTADYGPYPGSFKIKTGGRSAQN